jgi:SAM-dependent methyltransferase
VTDEPDLGALFSAAHAEFAILSPLLWEPAAVATLEAVKPRPGERVLDVCCGAGASALRAAEAVGPDGWVDAIDLATGLLALGRSEAAARGLDQLRFIEADATAWAPDGEAAYDVVQCVYGIFFLPEMDAAAARLAGLLRPGGRFAVTTWERDAIVPVPELMAQAVEHVRGEALPPEARRLPGASINTPDSFHAWLSALNLRDVAVTVLRRQFPLDHEQAWTLILGGGLRAFVMGLEPEDVERVRTRFVGLLDEHGVSTFNATTLVGVGTTPG